MEPSSQPAHIEESSVTSSGRYQVQEHIGSGGSGTVFAAWDTQLERRVALKRVHLSTGTPSGQMELLRKEAKLLASLNHPNIVQVFDVGIDEDGPFFVMELLEGEDLETFVEKGAIAFEDFLLLSRESLDALAFAHAGGMLHRDIKPGNIMLCPQRNGMLRTKILDFGLAKISQIPTAQTVQGDGSIWGTIYTVSPEQLNREDVTQRSDLYSLGCTIYFALAGSYPFTGESTLDVISAHLNHEVLSICEYRPDINEQLESWLHTLISRHPQDRFRSATQALRAFSTAAGLSGEWAGHNDSTFDMTVQEEFEAALKRPSGALPETMPASQLSSISSPASSTSHPSAVRAPAVKSSGRVHVPKVATHLKKPEKKSSFWLIGILIVFLILILNSLAVGAYFAWRAGWFATQVEMIPNEPIPAGEVERIARYMGHKITVTGKLYPGTGQSDDGQTVYLSFSSELGEGLALGFPLQNYSGETADSLRLQLRRYGDREVEVSGVIGRDSVATVIWVDTLDQITKK